MTAKASILRITYSTELLEGGELHVSSNCLPVKASRFEPAGHSFHDVALKLCGCFMDEKKEVEETDESVPKEKDQDYMQSSGSYSGGKGKKKSGDGANQQDHYALLGLGNLRYLATDDQIRKSYREVALKHHPDKQASLLLLEETEAGKQSKKDEIENHFKAIQEAYEVLIDPVKRRVFDSTDEFDDEIPTDCGPQDFFKVFGPAFLRNGRWSVTQPTPLLGDENTPLDDVDSFYDFWYGFKSWREFPHDDEYDLEDAESREEKRWMERQNAKLSEKAKKEESARIRSLVDNAYKRDPRVLKRKELLKAEKQKKKEAKFMVKKLQEEEAARVAEEERRKKEEDEKQAAEAAAQQKKIKEKEKKLLRKERSRLRTVSTNVVDQRLLDLNQDDVENLCMSLDVLKLKSLCDDMETQEECVQAELLKKALDNLDPSEKDNNNNNNNISASSQRNGSVKVNGNVQKQKKEKPWTNEEIELLRKGMSKYPKGTSRRWEVISEYIGTHRPVDEILKATKTVLLQKPDPTKAFDTFLEKKKPSQPISSPPTTQEENKTVEVNQNTNEVVENGVESGVENGTNSDSDEWSVGQVTALIQALKTFPKEANQRWERVAAAVPGKTVNQCKKQFTLLKDKFKTKKK
ncbi:putative transcription factor MYB-HB-like family [Helianthus annuus]|nr:putative transcription factor MYB-HB-like family [Helianthus annuus]KAJ0634809.1 putative transcription factor MYB-HB-like family [Helianthus annuus]KAJ0824502.1 putative transcription factor MYB-HB-like family [Helianthus annuus]